MRLSYSSINTYELCPAKFKFQYEDRVPQGRSAALSFGDSLHRALHLFHNRPVPIAPPVGELLEMLEACWVSDGFVDASEERTYVDHGRQVLTQYHRENAEVYRFPPPRVPLHDRCRGRRALRRDRSDGPHPRGGYEIVDYKTNRRLPPQARIDQDLQLSIYHMAAREIWGIEPERLTLYYLLPGQRMTTVRTPRDVDELRRRIGIVAERIEAGKFEPQQNPLCDWCEYQRLCPLFRHRYEQEEGDPTPRVTEMVDEWITLKRQTRAGVSTLR
jgi:CRISPR/Cas system-associated exonuclease Cas4 (RecB family)